MFRHLVVCLLLIAGVAAQSDAPAYRLTASFPAIIGGKPIVSFEFDAKTRRLYGGADTGLFWLNVDEPRPAWNGPLVKGERAGGLEFAPDLRRLFFTSLDDVRYVDVEAPAASHVVTPVRNAMLVYEPQQHELYVAGRDAKVLVFDAKSGASHGSIETPGGRPMLLDAIPGRVFMSVSTKNGLYVINAASHKIGAWPVEGKVDWPAPIEVDPSGRYIFAATYQGIAVIDPATAKVIGRIDGQAAPSIAFDAEAQLLIATWPNDPPPIRVRAYRVGATGLTLVSEMENPDRGQLGVKHTGRGFIQNGGTVWLLWSAVPRR